MAKPIEATPVLKGEDARAFWKSIDGLKHDEKKEAVLQKSKAIYRLFSEK
ncbi:MAG TPA: hypothetical protein VFF13_00840 [archaeon]|nr:hypothetical protein [archaeon]